MYKCTCNNIQMKAEANTKNLTMFCTWSATGVQKAGYLVHFDSGEARMVEMIAFFSGMNYGSSNTADDGSLPPDIL